MPIVNHSQNLGPFNASGKTHGRGCGKLLERAIGMTRLCGPTILSQHNPGAFLGTVMGMLDQALGKQPALRVKGLPARVEQGSRRQKWAQLKRERSRGHRA
jgi:hypothetical protein